MHSHNSILSRDSLLSIRLIHDFPLRNIRHSYNHTLIFSVLDLGGYSYNNCIRAIAITIANEQFSWWLPRSWTTREKVLHPTLFLDLCFTGFRWCRHRELQRVPMAGRCLHADGPSSALPLPAWRCTRPPEVHRAAHLPAGLALSEEAPVPAIDRLWCSAGGDPLGRKSTYKPLPGK